MGDHVDRLTNAASEVVRAWYGSPDPIVGAQRLQSAVERLDATLTDRRTASERDSVDAAWRRDELLKVAVRRVLHGYDAWPYAPPRGLGWDGWPHVSAGALQIGLTVERLGTTLAVGDPGVRMAVVASLHADRLMSAMATVVDGVVRASRIIAGRTRDMTPPIPTPITAQWLRKHTKHGDVTLFRQAWPDGLDIATTTVDDLTNVVAVHLDGWAHLLLSNEASKAYLAAVATARVAYNEEDIPAEDAREEALSVAYQTFLAPRRDGMGKDESREDRGRRFKREAKELAEYEAAETAEWQAYFAMTAAARQQYATTVAPPLLTALQVAIGRGL